MKKIVVVKKENFFFQAKLHENASHDAAQCGNDFMEALAELKLLDYNLEKSCYVVMSGKKARSKVNKKLD